jgi:hypothetical protein
MFVTDAMVQTAFDVLNETRGPAAAAAKEKRQAEAFVKATRARLFLGYVGSVAERNAKAEVHPDMRLATDREAEAHGRVVEYSNRRADAVAMIDAWRTESANYRGMARVG